jgi:lysophospholipase L1-like esterase
MPFNGILPQYIFAYIMKTKLLFLFILSELMVVFLLANSIFNKSNNSPGVSINPINKDSIEFFPTSELKYYYEPKQSYNYEVNPWVPYSKGIKYYINNDTLNDRFDYSKKKSPTSYRIITLGDSFTFGLYVDTENNWTEKLEDLLNEKCINSKISKYEVINLGVHGYDIRYVFERFKKRGIKYNPDLIIWFIVNHNRLVEKTIIYEKKIISDLKIDKHEMAKESGDYYKSWNMASELVIKELGINFINEYQLYWLNEFNKHYRKDLLFLIGSYFNKNQRRFYLNYVRNRPNSYLEIISLHKNEVLPNDGHPSEYGHQVIAQDVYDYLIKNKLVPCN